MTTVNKNKVQNDKNIEELITALYCRLSVEDIKDEDGKKKKKEKEDEFFYIFIVLHLIFVYGCH